MLSPIALDDDNTSSSRPIPIPARARPLHLHPIVIGGQEQPMSLSDRQYYRWSVPHWQAYDPASAAPFSSSSSSSSSPHLPPPLTCDASPSSSSWAPFHTLHKQSVHDLFLPHPVLPISKLDFLPSPSEESCSSVSTSVSPPSPQPLHVVCDIPLVAPKPLPYHHSPTFLQFDLPDVDQDLSHPPYTRRPRATTALSSSTTAFSSRKRRAAAALTDVFPLDVAAHPAQRRRSENPEPPPPPPLITDPAGSYSTPRRSMRITQRVVRR